MITQGANVLRGERLVVDLTTSFARVEGKGRVQGLFSTNKDDKPAGKDDKAAGKDDKATSGPETIRQEKADGVASGDQLTRFRRSVATSIPSDYVGNRRL